MNLTVPYIIADNTTVKTTHTRTDSYSVLVVIFSDEISEKLGMEPLGGGGGGVCTG